MSSKPHQQTPWSACASFDDQNDRYRLCCCHVRIWAIVIGILELILCLLDLMAAPLGYGNESNQAQHASGGISALVGGVIGSIIWIVVVILMLYGLKKEQRLLLIPHIVLQVITIISFLIGAALMLIFTTVYGTTTNDRDEREVGVGISIGMGVTLLICAFIEAFFLYPIIRCYRYLADKALAKEAAAHVPMATTYSTIENAI